MSRILFRNAETLSHEGDQPTTAIWEAPVTALECGIWEHSAGVSTDVEVHEVFVVLAGRARIEVEGQADLVIGPGDVVELDAGAKTRWHVEEALRKFWVIAPDGS